MARLRSRFTLHQHGLALALGVAALGVLTPAPADAHFVLVEPASWMPQAADGTPQKLGPCGDENDATEKPTSTVTAFQEGDTITVTVNETVYHRGHYRISLAVNDRSELPAEPKVTAETGFACGSVPVQTPPVFPVLADGVFDHSAPFTAPQTTKIKLPANVTCTHCTLQIIEFMADHGLNMPGGCFYHHCADISISGAGGSTASTTTTATSTVTVTATGTGGAGVGGAGAGAAGGTGPASTAATTAGPSSSTGVTSGIAEGSVGSTGTTTTQASTGTGTKTSSTTATTGGAGGSGGAAGESSSDSAGGCGCSVPARNAPGLAGLAGLLGLAAMMRRRRRR